MQHKRALITIAVAAGLDGVLGVVFARLEHLPWFTGIYWAVTTATTVGYGDVAPHTTSGRVVAIVVMVTVVPLFAATFSLFTSGLTSTHVQAAAEDIKDHVENRLAHHIGKG